MIALGIIVLGAVLAGYIVALIGRRHEFRWASGVGMLLIVTAFVSMRQRGLDRPGWTEIVLAGCGPLAALVGAGIRILTK